MGSSFAFEYNLEDELRKTVDKLWNKHKVTGEMNIIKLPDGKWHLEIHAENDIRESIINSLPGKRVKTRSISAGRVKSNDPTNEDEDITLKEEEETEETEED